MWNWGLEDTWWWGGWEKERQKILKVTLLYTQGVLGSQRQREKGWTRGDQGKCVWGVIFGGNITSTVRRPHKINYIRNLNETIWSFVWFENKFIQKSIKKWLMLSALKRNVVWSKIWYDSNLNWSIHLVPPFYTIKIIRWICLQC